MLGALDSMTSDCLHRWCGAREREYDEFAEGYSISGNALTCDGMGTPITISAAGSGRMGSRSSITSPPPT